MIFRFWLLNLFGFGLLLGAWWFGYIGVILAADETRLVVVIFAVFLAGLAVTFHRMTAINVLRNDTSYQLLKLSLPQQIRPTQDIANTLVLLGLIGTVVGIIVALSGVDPDAAADVASIPAMVSTMLKGMSTALYTTLVGSILSVWMMLNYRLLRSGANDALIAAQVRECTTI